MTKCAKWIAPAIVILCMIMINGASANAQTKNPCADDVAKFCKDVKPGGGRLAKCLKQHESELSAGCQDSHEKLKARAKEAHEACADDVQKLCKDVKPGGGRIVNCLKDNSARLSPECREKLVAAKKKAK